MKKLGNKGFTSTGVLHVANLCDGLQKAVANEKKHKNWNSAACVQRIRRNIKEGVRINRATFRVV